VITIERLKDIHQLKDYEVKWNQLVDEDKSLDFSSRFEWVYSWLLYHKDNYKEIFILIAKDNHRVVGIAPLVITQKNFLFKINILKFACWNLAFYKDFILKQADENLKSQLLKLFIEYIRNNANCQILELDQLKEDSFTFKKLKDIAKVYILQNKSIYLEVTSSWDKYWQGINKSIRKNLNWLKNKGLEFSVCQKKEDINLYLEKLFSFHIKRWKDSKYKKEKHREFLKTIAELFFNQNILYLSAVKFQQKIIAVCLGYKYKNRLYYALPSFDIDFYKYSPGKYLLFNIIKQGFLEGVKEVDLLVGEDRYKYNWANKERNNYKVVFFLKKSIIWLIIYKLKLKILFLKRKIHL
jgi:CelD/BcsL family acetyltransferase involved in cellulose biosynthesis